ncbi:MAG TPA: hypothetical protein VHX92_08840 [Rhizomicrobium sp.]|nr:hypothetical protein [Rhizomicrobium sp.]
MRSAPRAVGQRTFALLIALALQISFLLLLAQAVLKPSLVVRQLARELTLTLHPLPMPRLPAPTRAVAPQITVIRPDVTAPAQAPSSSSVIPIVPLGALQGFGQALNNCAPENYANLPEDKKALCSRPGAGVAVQQAPNLMGVPSHVKDEAHWQAELGHEQSATLLPCGGFLNIACLLGKIADGTLSDYGDPRTWPTYETKQLQPEDFYKIQQAYDDWHKAHGTK